MQSSNTGTDPLPQLRGETGQSDESKRTEISRAHILLIKLISGGKLSQTAFI